MAAKENLLLNQGQLFLCDATGTCVKDPTQDRTG